MVPQSTGPASQGADQRADSSVSNGRHINTVGDGVSELRFHFGPGYRVYFAQKGDVVMLLLAGGDKRTQPKDIDRARRMLAELKEDKQW